MYGIRLRCFSLFLLTLPCVTILPAQRFNFSGATQQAPQKNEYRLELSAKQAMVGQTVQLHVISPLNFTLEPDAIRIQGGAEYIPNTIMRSQNTTILNNVMSNEITSSFSYRITAPGPVTFGPVTIYVNAQPIDMGTVTLDVVSLSDLGLQEPNLPELGTIANPRSDRVDVLSKAIGNIFSAVEAPTTVYEGEAFVVSTWLYQKPDSIFATALPSNVFTNENDGFQLIEALDTGSSRFQTRFEPVPNLPYTRTPILNIVHYPIKTGTLEVAGVSLDFITSTTRLRSERLFVLDAPKKSVEVLPLPPTDGPVNFRVVGNVMMASKFDITTAKVGDIVKITHVLSGEAYLKPVVLGNPPITEGLLPVGEDSRFVQVSQNRFPMQSRVSFELAYQVVHPGEIMLPRLRLATFDPITKSYTYQTSDEYKLMATGAPLQSVALGTNSTDSENAVQNPTEIEPEPLVESGPFPTEDILKTPQPLFSLHHFFLFNFILLLIGFVGYAFREFVATSSLYRSLLSANQHKANLSKQYAECQQALNELDIDRFYSLAHQILRRAVLQQYRVNIQGLSIREVADQLQLKSSVSAETRESILSLLNNMEEQKFRKEKSKDIAESDGKTLHALMTGWEKSAQ